MEAIETPTTEPTPGPWRWEFNPGAYRLQICGGDPKRHGRYDLTVMDFVRWGFNRACPRLRRPIREHLNIMERADNYAVVCPSRAHHADWFKLLDHPDAHLIAAAPALRDALRELYDEVVRLDLGHEGSNLLERMVGARVALDNARGDIKVLFHS